uniref:(northern house mosquito) hypothetical protein n=1 Tax=Culex pipiens TaxID=7175 RepID=A0A8D8D2P0_CULPI
MRCFRPDCYSFSRPRLPYRLPGSPTVDLALAIGSCSPDYCWQPLAHDRTLGCTPDSAFGPDAAAGGGHDDDRSCGGDGGCCCCCYCNSDNSCGSLRGSCWDL